jgi:hypothetical protein
MITKRRMVPSNKERRSGKGGALKKEICKKNQKSAVVLFNELTLVKKEKINSSERKKWIRMFQLRH